jgi:HemK-like putative methylase
MLSEGGRKEKAMAERFISAQVLGRQLELETRPGLFSPEHVDRGTLAMLSVARLEPGMQVLDLGCGCGVVGITAAKICGEENVMMCDIDPEAVKIAISNAERNGVAGIKAVVSDGLSNVDRAGFDMILSNPPYIASGVIPTLQKEITEHEPMLALDGGNDGLDVYRALIPKLPEHLKKEGVVLMEIGHDQMEAVCDFLAVNGNFIHIQGMQDLAGKDRIVMAVLLSN